MISGYQFQDGYFNETQKYLQEHKPNIYVQFQGKNRFAGRI